MKTQCQTNERKRVKRKFFGFVQREINALSTCITDTDQLAITINNLDKHSNLTIDGT